MVNGVIIRSSMENRTLPNKLGNVFVITVFFIVALLAIRHHEMWRDELQAWLIARDSTNITDLFKVIRYEGTPGLWHLSLFGITRFTSNPFYMQILQLFITTATAAIFVVYSPFKIWQKLLFVFGYFPLFEYGVLSRSYSLTVLLAFAFCAIYPKGKILPAAVIIFFLSQTNVFGLAFAIGFCFLLFTQSFSKPNNGWLAKPGTVFSSVIFAVGLWLAYLQMRLPADYGFVAFGAKDYGPDGIKLALSTIWRSYVPIPQLTGHFWNTNILNHALIWQPWLALALLAISVFILQKKPLILFFFMGEVLFFLAFFYFKYYGAERHLGQIYLTFVVSFWLSESMPTVERKFERILNNSFLTLLFLANVMAAYWAIKTDWSASFSADRQAAALIKDQKLDHLPMVGDLDFNASPLTAYMDNKVYFPRGERNGTYIIWDKKRQIPKSPDEVVKIAHDLAINGRSLLISSWKIQDESLSRAGAALLASYPDSIVKDESLYLYLIKD